METETETETQQNVTINIEATLNKRILVEDFSRKPFLVLDNVIKVIVNEENVY